MKKSKKLHFKLTPLKLSLIVLTSAFMAWVVYAASAATGSISVASDKATVTQGTTFSVLVSETTDTPINVAHTKINYDVSKLVYRGIEYIGSPFTENSPEASNGSGYIIISRYKVGGPYPTGNNFLAKLTFEAISAGGSTTVSVAPGNDSMLLSTEGSNILSSVGSVKVSLVSPPVTPQPPQPPKPNPVSPTKPTPTPTPTQSNNVQAPSPKPTPKSNPEPAVVPTNPEPTTTNNEYPSYPQTIDPEVAYILPKPSLTQRLLALLRRLIPVLVIAGIAGVGLWLILKKIKQRPFGFNSVTAGSHGVGSVKPMVGNNQNQPTNDNLLSNNPTSPVAPTKSDGNDNTPRTFSGV